MKWLFLVAFLTAFVAWNLMQIRLFGVISFELNIAFGVAAAVLNLLRKPA